MDLPVQETDRFDPLLQYARMAQKSFGASAAAVVIIQKGQILAEWYSGTHHNKQGALPVTDRSMFNIYSVRKTYVGMALALALVENRVPWETPASDWIKELSELQLGGTTFYQMATKTDAKFYGLPKIEREEVANKVIKQLTGHTVAGLLKDRILNRLKLEHTEWMTAPRNNLVCDFQAGYASVRMESEEGHERNLYTNARDLAYWGYLHVNKGVAGGQRVISSEVFQLIDQLRKQTGDKHRIFGWYYTRDGYYATGAAGCHIVVLPDYEAVAVRMLNHYTERYEEDQMKFNELFKDCLIGS